MTELLFSALRRANLERLPLFKNAQGGPAHSQPDGSDWALSAWCNATLGELGELANLIKKIERGDVTLDAVRKKVADELADVVTYLDILAFRCGVDLGAATIAKWNRVSERVGVATRLASLEPDMFWNADDPVHSHDDLSDFTGYGECDPGDVLEVMQAVRWPTAWVYFPLDPEEGGGLPDPQVFATKAEAAAAQDADRARASAEKDAP